MENKLRTDTRGYDACQEEEFVLNSGSEQLVEVVLNTEMM